MMRLLVISALLCVGCATSQNTAEGWSDRSDVIAYRLLTRDDFKAKQSHNLWGNIAHGAEVCTNILAADDYAQTARFQGMLKQSCSYWNNGFGRGIFNLGMAVVGAAGLPSVQVGSHEPWYVLQHEQIHFAIMHIQALRLSQATASDPSNYERNRRLHAKVMQRARELHHDLDSETSGNNASAASLERWVRKMERDMRKWCGRGRECPVRTN